jgi:hypothetical protein
MPVFMTLIVHSKVSNVLGGCSSIHTEANCTHESTDGVPSDGRSVHNRAGSVHDTGSAQSTRETADDGTIGGLVETRNGMPPLR